MALSPINRVNMIPIHLVVIKPIPTKDSMGRRDRFRKECRPGKWGRVISLKSEQTTQTVSSRGTPVLVLGEARSEDSIQSPTESHCKQFVCETTDVIDLYSVESNNSSTVKPFLHQVLFDGPNGEIVRV